MERLDRPIVVGSGVAGLSTALALGSCTVVTKTRLGAGSSDWAQGGVAAAVGADDSPGLHAADTVAVSAGLAVEQAVDLLTMDGPEAIDRLVQLGAEFDRLPDGSLALGREAGHSRRRIVHANGDATGAEIMRALVAAADDRPSVEVVEDTSVVDLVLSEDGTVAGVVVVDASGRSDVWLAPAVVIATGGIGRLYARTTNPLVVTGDGIAIAARAGATLADMEFVQFHPTALDAGLDPMPLLTEALRGEGAHLVDGGGRRYMLGEHPDAELAPRDVVARANYRRRGDTYLDARMVGADFPRRFPTVYASAMAAGIDPRVDVMPVSAACHYFMGGIAASPDGVTSIPGLFAVGEAASTGVHGANRLASNSLLEGLVFGKRAARAVSAHSPDGGGRLRAPLGALEVAEQERSTDDPHGGPGVGELRELMWECVGVERSEASLVRAEERLQALGPVLAGSIVGRNMATVARLVIGAARTRRESRGAHFRLDHPATDPALRHRTIVTPGARFEPIPVTVP